jgi:hypothetical protein
MMNTQRSPKGLLKVPITFQKLSASVYQIRDASSYRFGKIL